MVIDDPNLFGPLLCPAKDDTPLLIDPDGMEAVEFPLERFKPVPGWDCEIGKFPGPIHLNEFAKRNSGNRVEPAVLLFVEELFRVGVCEGLDHAATQIQFSRDLFFGSVVVVIFFEAVFLFAADI